QRTRPNYVAATIHVSVGCGFRCVCHALSEVAYSLVWQRSMVLLVPKGVKDPCVIICRSRDENLAQKRDIRKNLRSSSSKDHSPSCPDPKWQRWRETALVQWIQYSVTDG